MLRGENNNREHGLNHCHLPDYFVRSNHSLTTFTNKAACLLFSQNWKVFNQLSSNVLMMRKLLHSETKKIGRKGQNDNDHHVPETKPGTPMTTELF